MYDKQMIASHGSFFVTEHYCTNNLLSVVLTVGEIIDAAVVRAWGRVVSKACPRTQHLGCQKSQNATFRMSKNKYAWMTSRLKKKMA
jgi:hypothetical protein